MRSALVCVLCTRNSRPRLLFTTDERVCRKVFFFFFSIFVYILCCRSDEEGARTTDARRVRAAVPAQEPRTGAQVVQRLDVARKIVQTARIFGGSLKKKKNPHLIIYRA